MKVGEKENIGLSTADALKKLHDDIATVLENFQNRKNKKLPKDKNEILPSYSIFITLLVVIGLIYTSFYFTGVLLFLILVLNVVFVHREEKLKKTELKRKAEQLLEEINLSVILSKDWKSINYPHLYSPLSPCISLVWTYRDNELVNLPTALLVEGDHIVMRLGMHSPGSCSQLVKDCNSKTTKTRKFKLGDSYGLNSHPSEPLIKPKAVQPLPDIICMMEHTPYVDNLKASLEKFLDRPPTIHNRQRHILTNHYMQRYIFVLTLILILTTITLRAFDSYYIKGKVHHTTWYNIGVLNCVSSLISLLPLIFPLIWINLHHWGTARLETLLSIPQPLMHTEKLKSSPEMMDTPTSGDMDLPILPRRQVWCNYLSLLNGSCELLSRSTNIVQILGSISAFCCVDKKGILSWPNPTPEKVFFLTDSTTANSKSSSECSLESEISNEQSKVTAEVLDITHDQNSPFKLEFDDHEWKNYINSLKPLGLAILVNTCCEKTQFSYSKFCGHITASSLIDKNLVPATNRYATSDYDLCASFMHGRCLCELARQIGFQPQAKNIFNLEAQISSYRHLQPEVIRRDIRFTKSLHLASKIKVPFPHSLSVVVKEAQGGLQLLTQGTADIILDSCDDFWSGRDLRPLKEEERKRAQDFYQRNALTAYCTAFSYRPLRHGITGILAGPKSNDLLHQDEVAYLELPPESFDVARHNDNYQCDYEGHSLSHSISSDSLLFSDNKEESVNDVEGCFEMQCHQIFIGMVTMQYQAQTDIVQLIEKFERACIRFVHFSKENELRSRVFSEKMGLESGWNCHISLLAPEEQSTVSSPKHSRQLDGSPFVNIEMNAELDCEYSRLLPQSNFEASKALSSSAPCAISNPDATTNYQEKNEKDSRRSSLSKDSVIDGQPNEDMNNQSLSCTTDSSEQSATQMPYLSNRAKLPRGIKNIEPHIQNVDNVPLLVSLFTDCSPEATQEMLRIMQSHGEVCVVMGSSANANSNTNIFLQANCAIGCEPLYPQVCQNYPAYTESNIYNNKQLYLKHQPAKNWFEYSKSVTISPVYISRMLNSLPCSISVCRDDPISILGLIELARRFSIGLWNCVQFWCCSAVMFSILNLLSCAISLPPILSPDWSLYLMLFVVCPLAISLVRVEPNSEIMNRACGRKPSNSIDINTFLLILWFYGTKFIVSVIIIIIVYTFTVDHVFDFVDEEDENFLLDLNLARCFTVFALTLHLVVISSTFVHREHSLWSKNPISNVCWLVTSCTILIFHVLLLICQLTINNHNFNAMGNKWPVLFLLIISTFLIIAFAEL
ncbi:CLUMA_CG017819, isoform A [Clunio marinus]|uniref:CLUMA_CG017819, isoform A n=1 Tax=Clunio marinus TaxID=568069 RepID=A0A1J1IX82_9DIPT|nr:CLUMA_CG017819, isoform A [Clunio marinus]